MSLNPLRIQQSQFCFCPIQDSRAGAPMVASDKMNLFVGSFRTEVTVGIYCLPYKTLCSMPYLKDPASDCLNETPRRVQNWKI
jgi:hypothetical protein